MRNEVQISFALTQHNKINFHEKYLKETKPNTGSYYYSKHLLPSKAILFFNIKNYSFILEMKRIIALSNNSYQKNITEMNNIANKFPYNPEFYSTNTCISVLEFLSESVYINNLYLLTANFIILSILS